MKIGYNEPTETYFVYTCDGSGRMYLNKLLKIVHFGDCKFATFEEAQTAIKNREHLDRLGENKI